MDQPHSKACEMADDVKHRYSFESLDYLGKEKVLPNSCRKFDDADTLLEKQACRSDQEINSCEGKTSHEMKCPNYYLVSAGECKKEHNTTSELDVARAKGNWLNAGEDGLHSMHANFHEQLLNTESSSSNSTSVILPVSSLNDSYQEMSVEAKSSMHGSSSTTNFICMGFKCGLEEPATTSVILDMAVQITQKAVGNVRARDSKIELGMIANQNSMIVEKVDISKSSLQKQKCAELLSQDKGELSYELDDTLDLAKKAATEVEQKVVSYREPSGISSSMDERNGETVHYKNPNKTSCSMESGGLKLRNEQDKCDSFCSSEVVVDPEILTKSKCFLAGIVPPQKTDPLVTHEAIDGPHGKESSQFITKTEVVAASDQSPLGSRFDLNDDIQANEVEYPKQSGDETASFYSVNVVSSPIPVLAKCGVPMFLPMASLKFEGEQGWKGSAATSAFRPAFLSNCSNGKRASSVDDTHCCLKVSQGFAGIDLNVASVGDDSAIELLRTPCLRKPSDCTFKESSEEVGSKGAERLNIDLNRLSENDDNCPQSSPPVLLSGHSVVDFDLNDNPSLGDTCISARQLGQDSQPLRSKATDVPAVALMRNSSQQDFNPSGPVYCTDVSSSQGFNHGHVQPFLVAAPNVVPQIEQMQRIVSLQPKLPWTVPPHIYPYNNGFCIGPTDQLSSDTKSSTVLPYIRHPCGMTLIPQTLGAGTLSTFLGAPHLMEGSGGSSPSDIRYIRPNFDVYSGEHSSETGNRKGNAGKFSYPVKISLREEQIKSTQQVSAIPMKRREPEGGWDTFQL